MSVTIVERPTDRNSKIIPQTAISETPSSEDVSQFPSQFSFMDDQDAVIFFRDARWEDYEYLLALRGERSAPRIAYLEGVIELMSPSFAHEGIKSIIGRLVEVYCLERGIRFTPVGAWLLKQREDERGVEPDECYVFGPSKERDHPHLAIEVFWTSGRIDKLEIYRKLGVEEVWIWRRGEIEVYVLRDEYYHQIPRSEQLPELDLALLLQHLDAPTAFDAIQAYRAALRDQATNCVHQSREGKIVT